MKKFALVSHVLPPSPSGQSIMIGKILREIPENRYILFSGSSYYKGVAVQDELPGKTYTLPVLVDSKKIGQGIFNTLKQTALMLTQIRHRAKIMEREIKNNKINALVVCSGDFSDMAAGYQVARRNRDLELIPYYFDYFSYQFPGIFRHISNLLEKLVMKRSKLIIVPNEFLHNSLDKRYGVKTALVRNPHDGHRYPASKKKSKNFTVIYTGAIYEAQLQPVKIFAQAVNKLSKEGQKITFNIYTPDSKEQLKANNLLVEASEAVQFHPPVTKEESQTKQAEADMLYLPLAANTSYPEIIKTSCPGKMSEYLNSGTPIFAHVPEDSYVAWYLGKNQAGEVMCSMTPPSVKARLKEIIKDPSGLKKYLGPALKAADDFSIKKAQEAFSKIVS